MEQTTENFGLPRLNEPAPHFAAVTTHGTRTLADYKGKWLILFSHPADFTPVCTTEFMGFAREAETFKSMNCELLGLSIDSIFAHLAWVRSIKQHFGVDIPFPIIEDLKMDVARAYGMIHPGAADTQAVRATFFIDPNGVLRAMVYYPMSNGRSIDDSCACCKPCRPATSTAWPRRKPGARATRSSCPRRRPPPLLKSAWPRALPWAWK
jgi:1-Cys peroxiredoxin (EC 1.11.1.15)